MSATPRQSRLLSVGVGVALILAVLALLSSGWVWLTRSEPHPQSGALRVVQSSGGAQAQSPPGHAPFVAVGSISALHPGQLRTLQVKVTNPDAVDYRILELTATPQDANASCSGPKNLVVSSYQSTRPGARTYVVPRKSSITIPLTIMMLDTATSQDSCKNASFPLTFGGMATEGQGDGSS